ncbi:S-adenosylmethionine:tRNA-ribosyltransferase-isomerase [Candidatus Scalindua japonica]|uniref:S-adenosylmethionine:tRNA ribosyltransferase-isomerase n=1 Tax=Candidatus Scalindua japonica TaxID=1284222 RepID=A0A286U1Q9_9BACT|nr:tRNA preQ1(34) S-adenosylmethionine ribosyltransferase-isomerase QueA [Candidatus Scalindua japonica]GAX62079.1 S-adenosylmethionine:tRNA-ribosyltransferase-isomerase [Candidatus Scalindua japonica]
MNTTPYKTSNYDYDLPKNLIAQYPITKRDESRLLVLHKKSSRIEHRKFHEIIEYLNCGDVLVLNDTKVSPARIHGTRTTGGKVEGLIIKELEENTWEVLLQSNHRLKENEVLNFDNGVKGQILWRNETGSWIIRSEDREKFIKMIESSGRMPLPPYIKRDSNNKSHGIHDEERYQTIYAKTTGAIAAPTAGLHFTSKLLEEITCKGINIVYITLHVGLGTFKPIHKEDFRQHTIHKEFYNIPEEAIDTINKAKSHGKRIIATGTTTCRALETIAKNQTTGKNSGWTNLFIYPPYKFKLTDSLITNFHLQRSTLLLLVSAFAGRENIATSYEEAISHSYRFYSYGDCMLIL